MSDKKRNQMISGLTPAFEGEPQRRPTDLLSLGPISEKATKPWNPDWTIYQIARQHYLPDTNQELFVFACGQGDVAIRLAMLGYDVYASDPDPANIDWAKESALQHGVASHCQFVQMSNQDIRYDDQRFDLIVSLDALKTSDITQTANQLHRVLKDGGMAVFKEQIITPLDKAANATRALTDSDLALLESTFDDVQIRRFTILSRLDHLIPPSSQSTRTALQKLDRKLLELCPPMAKLGATAVITCRRHAQGLGDDIQFAA